MLEDSRLLSLILDRFQLFLKLLVLSLEASDLLFAHGLLLVDRLVVALILDAGVFFKGAPLILKLGHFLAEGVTVHAVPLCILIGVRKLSAKVSQFVTFLIKNSLVL